MAKRTTDADRRARQCQRMARLIRLLRLLLGHGRWGPDNLAQEMECSKRTILRDLDVLSTSGVPVFFDRTCEAYRIKEGFKFPGIDNKVAGANLDADLVGYLIDQAKKFIRDGETLLKELATLARMLESQQRKQ